MGMHGDYYTYRQMSEVTPTQMASGSTTALVCPPFIAELHGQSTVGEITEPLATMTAGGGHHGLVYPPAALLIGQQSAAVARPTDRESPAVSTAGAISLVRAPAPFLLSFYGGRHGTHGVDEALPVMPGWANHALIGANRSNSLLRSVTEEMHTVVAGGGQHFMLVPSGRKGTAHSVEDPARTVATHDCEALVGAAIAIEDCTFRMLAPHEIQAAMAFPAAYIVRGTARDRVKQLGNAVTPPVMELLFRRCVATLAG